MIRTITRFAVPAALLLAGCGVTGNGQASQSPATINEPGDLAEWAAGNIAFLEEGSSLMQSISDAAGDFDLYALEAACTDFEDWAQRGAARAPSPDPDVDQPWQAALDDAALAAETCIEGANGDVDALNRSSGHMQDFTEHIADATEAITD